jgi:uncharacterized protein
MCCLLGSAQGYRQPEEAWRAVEEAATVFSDPAALDWNDLKQSDAEQRSVRIGFSVSARILFVVYTVRRLKHGKETIRIISARQATRKERNAYAG